jgi:hypothetical protein
MADEENACSQQSETFQNLTPLNSQNMLADIFSDVSVKIVRLALILIFAQHCPQIPN